MINNSNNATEGVFPKQNVYTKTFKPYLISSISFIFGNYMVYTQITLLHHTGSFLNFFFQNYLIFQNRVLLIHNYRIHKAAFNIIAVINNFIHETETRAKAQYTLLEY